MVNGKPQLNGHALWASHLNEMAERDMPRLRPKNKKGIGGVDSNLALFDEDLDDLGITACTINFLLGSLHNPGKNPIEYTHQGKTWHFNRNALKTRDRMVKSMTERGVVVSAVLLVNKSAHVIRHPEFDPAGIYSMANVTSEAGTDAYRAVVSFLAERYSRPNKEYGWITNWIVFNEVDYGWTWTNMGEQPLALYMDSYSKAMRLTWLETRRFNPTSEVFISLTHNWDYSPPNQLRNYAPREMLDRMARDSNVTGDYHWGVAYHPYPQSLFNPHTWKDTKADPSFATRYITPKNIEVLDAYLHQPRFLYQDKARTVLLSEQGYHTSDYSEASIEKKAAAIAYTWEKILPLKTIESFHYHRWVDHPREGGLLVGLRTLPEPGKPYGIRKEPAFSLYSKLETDTHNEAIEPFKSIIGIDSWEEIQSQHHEIKR